MTSIFRFLALSCTAPDIHTGHTVTCRNILVCPKREQEREIESKREIERERERGREGETEGESGRERERGREGRKTDVESGHLH